MEDKKVIALYQLLEDTMEMNIDLSRKKLVLAEREHLLSGELKTTNWKEVKKMVNSHKKKD